MKHTQLKPFPKDFSGEVQPLPIRLREPGMKMVKALLSSTWGIMWKA